MSKPIESDALDRVYRVLGLSGGAVTKETILEDGWVFQMLGLNPIIRRSRTLADTTGWFFGVLLNEHAGAGALTSEIDPYQPAGASAVAPWPSIIRRGFDLWLLNASVIRNDGSGTLDGAALLLDPIAVQQGWGIDDGGTAVAAHDPYPLARWTGLDVSLSGSDPFAIAGDGSATVKIGLRWPRGATVRFISDVAGAAADIQCMMTWGMFVEGFGQDVSQ